MPKSLSHYPCAAKTLARQNKSATIRSCESEKCLFYTGFIRLFDCPRELSMARKTYVKTTFPVISNPVSAARKPRSRAQGGGKGEASILTFISI